MIFTEGQTYYFKPRDQRGTPRGGHLDGIFGMVYLRRVGKVDLFRSPSGGWLESFTQGQLADHEITKMRKSPSGKGPFTPNATKSGRRNARTHSNTGGVEKTWQSISRTQTKQPGMA